MTNDSTSIHRPLTDERHWTLSLIVISLTAAPLLGTVILDRALDDWSWTSLALHSTVEAAGAVLGLMVVVVMLFSRQREQTSRRMWVTLAVISMAVLDMWHSCVPEGVAFIWLHSVAVLAGGIFFTLAWFPERGISRELAWIMAGATLVVTTLIGVLSALGSGGLPAMLIDGHFTAAADAINLIGGGLTLLAAINFAVRYYRARDSEDLVFLVLCFLFGGAGVIFPLSAAWEAGWWCWHVLRLGGYVSAFWLAVRSYRGSENEANRVREFTVAQATRVANGDLTTEVTPRDDKDDLGLALQAMLQSLRENRDQVRRQDWLKTGIMRLNATARGDLDIAELSSRVITEVASYLDAQLGAIYLANEAEEPVLFLSGSYAYAQQEKRSNVFKFGEGLVGQSALEKQQILISNVPEDYVHVTSALGNCLPRSICITPLLCDERVKGVVELGTLRDMTDQQLEYLAQAAVAIGIAVEISQSRTNLRRSLGESQVLSEELQVQQEELRVTNEELEERAEQLTNSQEKLQVQQEELRVTNEELEASYKLLEREKKEVELAAKKIQQKAEEVILANKYKSEFLANMSHELRTPLNSLLLLAQGLARNKEANLTDEQLESARIIHGAGCELLNLINEILDLSKIEAGRMDVRVAAIRVDDIADRVRTSFRHMAEEKGLVLDVPINDNAPTEISSDSKRVDQIIRNLVSNAIKFTETGRVTVTFGRPAANVDLSRSGLAPDACLAVAIQDTGIGVAPEKQKIVFEAFQQADGGTSRKYGGTGLGLSISRELARLLGGEIQVESELGQGATFILYLPITAEPTPNATGRTSQETTGKFPGKEPALQTAPPVSHIPDDRESLTEHETVILVIEDDSRFAKVLRDKCHEKGLRCLVASNGQAGLELVARHLPGAIILDIHLPGMDGWAVLDALKENIRTRHIPVHIVSAEEVTTKSLRKGAISHVSKPLDQDDLEEIFHRLKQVSGGKASRVLVVEDDAQVRRNIVELIEDDGVTADQVGTAAEALKAIRSVRYACVILDLGLPDMDGHELFASLERKHVELPPVIVYTARDLTTDEEIMVREYAGSIVIKDVRSQERLLDEVSLFLHRVVSEMPETKQKIIQSLHDADGMLHDKKVLVVDDDMRTVFAVSRFLTERGMKPLKAENGERALRLLDEQPDVALVLMDIMMPLMDGYETIRRIRARAGGRTLPIIALTAKAMPEDREKCVAAGANDYMSKPVDEERLISMMRVWLQR